jgi:hypothetical protein
MVPLYPRYPLVNVHSPASLRCQRCWCRKVIAVTSAGHAVARRRWGYNIVLHQPFYSDTLYVFVSATLCVVGGVRDSVVSLVLRAVVST